ncbi:MAG TPA: ABC transporter ATP-binding protein, partial [Solirubrobacterales bacterium]|nr:ABC transporter ATP-binding protein [Solirubrobacterales bacterium]
LEDALIEFEGSVVLISHDRALLEAVGSRTIVVEDGKLNSYPSGWAEYQRRQDEREAETDAAAKGVAKKEKAANGNGAHAKRRDDKAAEKAVRKAARLEQRVEKAEADLKAVEEELADPAAWANPSRVEEATERHNAAKAAVEELVAQWEAAQGAAETTAAS